MFEESKKEFERPDLVLQSDLPGGMNNKAFGTMKDVSPLVILSNVPVQR